MTTTACQTKYKGDQKTPSKVTGFPLYITVLPFGIVALHAQGSSVLVCQCSATPSV
jgi:hypothetical protein